MSFQSLNNILKNYLSPEHIKIIKTAYNFSKDAHKDQVRKSNEPYITHPIEVAKILADLNQDVSIIVAALLHDVLEDCDVSEHDLEKKFNKEILDLVDGVTRVGKLKFTSARDEQAESFRKMFLAMARDIRVILIKLADRLHNMRTLKYLSDAKQLDIANETLSIYAPLAHRMGIWSIKWELEDLAFYYLKPSEFKKIKIQVQKKMTFREVIISKMKDQILQVFKQNKIEIDLHGRSKSYYSIYQKLQNESISLDSLYDILGLRIIVDEIPQCYQALGIVHSTFKPIENRFKDYIAVPKSNMYQSLHTTVIGIQGQAVEIQIRTKQMNEISEYGIAAHWRYKLKKGGDSLDENIYKWLRQVVDYQNQSLGGQEFIDELKLDLFIDEVYIFTPNGDIQTLPKGSTPIDFAYKIHTEIGHSCIGTKINDLIKPLDTLLVNGDRVEILTSKNKQPKLQWLNYVKTNQAKQKIKLWFKKQNIEETIQSAKVEFERSLVFSGIPKETYTKKLQVQLLKQLNLKNMDDLYLKFVNGEISQGVIFKSLRSLLNIIPEINTKEVLKKTKVDISASNILIMGYDNVQTRLSKCCNPLPGDPIVGYITLGAGVSVHRQSCKELLYLMKRNKERLIAAEWTLKEKKDDSKMYYRNIKIEGFDRTGILEEILHVITKECGVNISKLNTESVENGSKMISIIRLDLKNRNELLQIIQKLKKMSDIISIKEY